MHLDSVSYSVWTKVLSVFGLCRSFLGIFSEPYHHIMWLDFWSSLLCFICYLEFKFVCILKISRYFKNGH